MNYSFLSPMSMLKSTSERKEDIEEHNTIMQAYVGFQMAHTRKPCYLAPILDK